MTSQVRQVRQETGGSWRRPEQEDTEAAAGFPSQTISEIKTDSAASLRVTT